MSEILTSDLNSSYEDCIANNIPSRAFRYTAENKNVLSQKGAIYVGTGETRTNKMILEDSSNEAVENISYITGVLLPPTASSPNGDGTYVLKCIRNGSDITVGWVKESSSTAVDFASVADRVHL